MAAKTKDFLSRLDRVSDFTILMVMAICMAAGVAVMPLLDVEPEPKPRQGKTLAVRYSWAGSSPKVVEQNVTSRIEGAVASVKGVKSVSSVSRFGGGSVEIELKPDINVSAAKFEIMSAIRQIQKKFPEEVSYPVISGGEVETGEERGRQKETLLLTYRLNSPMKDEQLKEYVSRQLEPVMKGLDGVRRIEITGGREKYIEVSYDPVILRSHGITATDMADAIKAFMGDADIIGEVTDKDKAGVAQRHALYLLVDRSDLPLERIPVKNVGDATIYMGDLAKYEYKDKLPGSYYRLNGLSTIYLNVYVDPEASGISLSHKLIDKISEVESRLKKGVYMELTYNAAEKQETELRILVRRSLMSLLILLAFVWAIRRRWKYLFITTVTLAANILIAVLVYFLAGIRLHTFALAGITVSLGIIIDSSIVMVDHYLRHRDRNVFFAILAALLTTIGALVIIFFLPEHLQKDLHDFAWIVIINLAVSLVVALLFVPALIQNLKYSAAPSNSKSSPDHLPASEARTRPVTKVLLFWRNISFASAYSGYIRFAQRFRWLLIILLILAFGIPFFALPGKLGEKAFPYGKPESGDEPEWYENLYNSTLGSDFFTGKCKPFLSEWLGGTMRLFAEHIKGDDSRRPGNAEPMRLHIRGKMPVGGSMHELNDKMMQIERFLSGFPEIERFETNVGAWGGGIVVEFRKEHLNDGFPYSLENKVIGQLINIGGADWSTYGVSERGFSNSLNLAYRSNRIEMTGYNYERLYRYAEEMSEQLRRNPRVQDIIIETPGHENQEDEIHMVYDHRRIALDSLSLYASHAALAEMLSERNLGRYKDRYIDSEITLRSGRTRTFDLWHLENSYVDVGDRSVRLSEYMGIGRREAKNVIPRKNQEYVLRVAFNVLGSWSYTNKLIEDVTEEFNAKLPVGYKCEPPYYGWEQDESTQYWLLLLVVVIIYFICAVLFESLTAPLVIIILIPASLIGTFLTFYLTGIPVGSGGFASMVLLAGIVVNAGIYQMYEYRSLKRKEPEADAIDVYVRAFANKSVPVLLTVISTLLGMIPFLFDRKTDSDFWFTFAVGSMGGLLFSLIAYVFVMPITMRFSSKYQNK